MGEHGEPGDGHQGYEQHPERDGGDRDCLGVDHVRVFQGPVDDVPAERGRVDAWRVEQRDHLGWPGDLAGCDEREVVEQVLRVGHDPDDVARLSALAPGVSDAQVQLGGQPAGQGDFASSAGVAPACQGEHRLAVRAVRVLRTQAVRGDRARHGQGLILDHVDRAEPVREGGDLGDDLGAGVFERGHVECGAEACAGRLLGVGCHRRPDEGGCDRDGDQGQDQQLLAPLAAEQPPGPSDDRAPRGEAAVAGEGAHGAFVHRDAHWARPGASRDSGPGAGAVWSTIRPSRRNTTRSAQEASWASWVTTTRGHPALARVVHQAHHGFAVDRVQCAGRLVGQQQPAFADDGAGDRHALPFAAGQLVGVASARVGQARAPPTRRAPAARAFARRRRRARAGRQTFSAAVSPASRLKSWNT